MSKIAYISVRKLFKNIVAAFQEYAPEPSTSGADASPESSEESDRAKFKVSVNDLKIISSALLYYKKFLLKRKDYSKAETVAIVDDRIYQLILELEKQKQVLEQELSAQEEQVAA